jgi:hypothetical protein
MRQSDPARLAVPVGEHDHVQGPASAPVTLLEYGDYESEACPSPPLAHRVSPRDRYEVPGHPEISTDGREPAEREAPGKQSPFWPERRFC